MKFKGEENVVLWEYYMGKKFQQEDAEDDDLMDDNFEDYFEDDMDDDPDFGEDGFDSEHDDEPQAHGMVMEIEPIASVEAHEVNEVLVTELKKLSEYGKRLYDMKDSADFEDWMVSAITIASTYVSDVWHRLDAMADFANTGFEQSDDFNK